MKEKKFDYRDYISKNKFTLGKVTKTSNFENSVFENNTQPVRTIMTENSKYKGKDIWPDELDANDFGSKVTDIRQLKKGNMYFLLDSGMGDWHGEYKLTKIGSTYFFEDMTGDWGHSSSGKGNDLDYTKDEIIGSIKDGHIYNQK